MASYVGVVLPFVPRDMRSADGGGWASPPASRSSPQPALPVPAERPSPPVPFPRPPLRPSPWHWSSLPREVRLALVAAAAATLLMGAAWTRCGWAGCPDVQALAESSTGPSTEPALAPTSPAPTPPVVR